MKQYSRRDLPLLLPGLGESPAPMLVREGAMELAVAGKPYGLGPGDVGVVGSTSEAPPISAGMASSRKQPAQGGRSCGAY